MGKKLKVISKPIESLQEPWCDPAAGTAHDVADIEAYIKAQFAAKAGCFHYDTANNRYLVFADAEARDAYMDDPEGKRELLLAFFDAPFNYSAEISLETEQFNAVLAGTTGNTLAFTFDTKNKSGQSVGEDVVCTYTFVRGSVRKTVTQKYRAGMKVRMNIDEYIEAGTNSITIGIVGQSTLAATTVGVTYQVIDLKLTDESDISRPHDLSTTAQIEVPYSISGYGAKTMEWYLDGEQLPFVRNEDEITEAATTRTKYIQIEGLAQGAHSVQLRAFTLINGERFYSQTLYREFIVYTRAGKDPITAIGVDLPLGAPVVTEDEPLKLRGASQYLPYKIKLGLFNPTYATSTPLEIYLDDELLATLSMQNDREVEYELTVTTYGEKALKLKTGTTERSIPVEIGKSSTSIEEITQGLSLALSATGKSNSSSDRNVWKHGAYSTLFNGFKWLSNSGWNNGELIISGGAAININCAPLGTDATASGKTIEMEFSTRNVTDNDAVICDLRSAGGTGLLITASEASLTSQGGARVSTRYKAGENIRLAFVINRKSGSADKGLVMLYENGIRCGAASYAANDNFISAKTISIASGEGADIAIRHIRIYDTALTGDQILNNYNLYRGSAEEFLKVYNRNNIYEDGTSDFSIDVLSGQLPAMIITGDYPAIEATTDKKLQITVDVEYINLQDPSRSFTLTDAIMTPQGTSSMSYPKKNTRIYTRKKDTTTLYDADGNKVENRLYAFKAGAQPVDCWCFKGDYAESSGTHNTGIARLWNDAMKNAQIGGEYKCRTQAQQAAADSGYPYDVRTAIDGFPILMFYRLTENDPLVFIGKYNFNNDKSTESVFGFRDIPGFDSSKVECWEVLNNGHHLALFQDTANWNTEWSDAFEARYPDGSKDTTALKRFADWISSVSAADFAAGKHEHLDVYKMAAYYVYLMRFGAVDQVVKNAMFTTEDGVHWFYINYDNDTVNGLRNDGLLIYPPTIDRQSLDPTMSGVYAYAGHDSKLWNLLEADTEFMQTVSEVDSALYAAGLSYANAIRMFDTEQSGKWCERIYNQDSQYKYIGPFNDKGINNLFMLQGSRQSHRRWWLSERFSLLDAKFVSGEYKANSFEVKLAGAPIGLEFSVMAGVHTNYGYGVNNVPIQFGVELERGEEHTFSTTSVLNVGDPLRIYAAPYLEEIDITSFAPYLTQISIANVYSDRLGTKLRKLILGQGDTQNTALAELSGINQAEALEELWCMGFKGLKTLDLTRNTQLRKVYAQNSGLTSVTLPTGAPLDTLHLPASLQALTLDGLFSLSNAGLQIQNNGCNLTTIEITDCPSLDTQAIVESWIDYKTGDDSLCSLSLNGIDWEDVDVEWLIYRLGGLRELSLRGTIAITSATEEQLTALQQLFGKNCFSSASELYIKVPADAALYFIGPDSVRALSSAQYEAVATSGVDGELILSMDGSPSKVTFVDGFLTVGDIDSNTTITLAAMFIPDEGLPVVKRKAVSLQAIKYPTTGTIKGVGEATKKGVLKYQLTLGTHDEDAKFRIEWGLSGAAVTNGYASLGTTSDEEANVIINRLEESECALTAKIYRNSDNKLLVTVTKSIQILVGDIIMTASSNPVIMKICYQKGWAAHSNYMTAVEAAMVTDASSVLSQTNETTFNEFVHFINAAISDISRYITEITIPWTVIDKTVRIESKKVLFPNLKKLNATLTRSTNNITDGEEVYPVLTEITNGAIQYSYLNNNITKLTFPVLKTIYKGYIGIASSTNTPTIDLPELESADAAQRLFNLSNGILNLPKLKNYTGSLLTTANSVININAPLLEEIDALVFNGEILSLPNLKYLRGAFSGSVKRIELPSLTHIGIYNEEGHSDVRVNDVFTSCIQLEHVNINFNSLECIYGYNIFNLPIFAQFLTEEMELSNLRVISNAAASSATGIFHAGLKKLSAPKLVYLADNTRASNLLTYVDAPVLKNAKNIFNGLPLLTTLRLAGVEAIEGYYFQNMESLTNLELPSVKTIKITSGETPPIKNCPNLETLNLPSCTLLSKTSSYDYAVLALNSGVKTVNFHQTDPVTISGAALYTTLIECIEGYFSSINKNVFKGATKLHTIKMLAPTEPTMVSPGSNITNVGSEVPEGVEKTIHIREDATGFGEDSDWVTKFATPFGFTIVRDIPTPETENE